MSTPEERYTRENNKSLYELDKHSQATIRHAERTRAWILQAHRDGKPLPEIADAAHTTLTRVQQVIDVDNALETALGNVVENSIENALDADKAALRALIYGEPA